MSESVVGSAPLSPSRRTLVRGAVWTVPVISVAAAAPAFAVSCDVAVARPVTWTANADRDSSFRTQSGTTSAGGAVNVTTSYTGASGSINSSFNMSSRDRANPRDAFIMANTVPTSTSNTSGNYQSLTFTFTPAARDVTFTIEDIDRINNGGATPGYYDYLVMTSSAPWTSVNGSLVQGVGTLSDPWQTVSTAGNGTNDPRQEITVSFAGPVSQFTIRYGTYYADSRSTEFMFVTLAEMSFKTCT